jgi:hypothetical protein
VNTCPCSACKGIRQAEKNAGIVQTVTITLSRSDAEAIKQGPRAGQRFREASARELDAIVEALEANRD